MDQQPAQPQRIRSVTPPWTTHTTLHHNTSRNRNSSERAAPAPALTARRPPPPAVEEEHYHHHEEEDEDEENSIEDDLAFILHRYGGVLPVVPLLSPPPLPTPPPPSTNAVVPPGAHDYHPARQPRRSSLKPATVTRTTTTTPTRQSPQRGVPRVRSTEGTFHAVRVRGVRQPVHRRRSIGFAEQVERYDIPARTSFTAGECRAVWLQDDEVRAMKAHRKTLIRQQQARHDAANAADQQQQQQQQHQHQHQQQQQQHQQPSSWKATTTTTSTNTKTKFKTVAQQLFRTTTGSTGEQQRRSLSPLHRFAASVTGTTQHNNNNNNSTRTKPGRKFSWTKPRTFRKGVAPLSNPQNNTNDNTDTDNTNTNTNTDTNNRRRTGSYRGSYSGSFSGSGGGSVSGSSTTSDPDSFRGLEKYLDRSGRKQKTMAWDTVLLEQDEQEQYGYYDDERIAAMYQHAQTQHGGQQKVLDRARQDQQFAEAYLLTPRTMKLVRKSIAGGGGRRNTTNTSTSSCSTSNEDTTEAGAGTGNRNNNNDDSVAKRACQLPNMHAVCPTENAPNTKTKNTNCAEVVVTSNSSSNSSSSNNKKNDTTVETFTDMPLYHDTLPSVPLPPPPSPPPPPPPLDEYGDAHNIHEGMAIRRLSV